MLQEIAGCVSELAVGIEVVVDHIEKNKNRSVPNLDRHPDFRGQIPVAVVGGAPSLARNLANLHNYKCVIACGSVHDYLIENGVVPKYCVICDQDLIVLNYLKTLHKDVTYLVASQCNPKVFEHLKNYNTFMWHAHGDRFDPATFGENQTLIGGGCTVGTRAIVIALAFGYENIHLYGMDSSLAEDYKHHAYDFSTSEETIGNITEIKLGGEDSPTFKVADYMLGQLFDIKSIFRIYAYQAKFVVIGEGALSYIYETALAATKNVEKEVKDNAE